MAEDPKALFNRPADTLIMSHEAFVDSPISDGNRRSYDSILSAYTDHTSASSVSYYSAYSKKHSTDTKKEAAYSPYQDQYDAHKPSPLRISKASFPKSSDGSPNTARVSHICQLAVQRPAAHRANSDTTIHLTPPSSRYAHSNSDRNRTFLQPPASGLTNLPNSTPNLVNYHHPTFTTNSTPEIPPKSPLRNTAYATHLTAFNTTLHNHILSVRRLRSSVLDAAGDRARERDGGQTFLYSASASSNSSMTSLDRLVCCAGSGGSGKSTAASLGPRASVAASSVYSQLTSVESACDGRTGKGSGSGSGEGLTPVPPTPPHFLADFPIQNTTPATQAASGKDKERDKTVRFSVPATEGRQDMSAEEKVERIRRGRLSGWVMKRFESKRYEELAERALAEL